MKEDVVFSKEAQKDVKRIMYMHTHASCPICGCSIPPVCPSTFCEEHQILYEKRQREGVDTDELNRRWSDTLLNWRERPISLDKEMRGLPFESFSFTQKSGNWLIFMRYYDGSDIRAEPRLADSLAINIQTGEVRHFVEVMETDVVDDVQGVRQAPYQEELAAFWGHPEPTGFRQQLERRYHDDNHQLLIPELVQEASYPVYGVVNNQFDLSVHSVSWGCAIYRHIDMSFVFAHSFPGGKSKCIEISSGDAKERSVVYNLHAIGKYLPTNRMMKLFDQDHPQHRKPVQIGQASLLDSTFATENAVFTGKLAFWPEPYILSTFLFMNKGTVLYGESYGFSKEELLHLLNNLRSINKIDDVLKQYQFEYCKKDSRFFS